MDCSQSQQPESHFNQIMFFMGQYRMQHTSVPILCKLSFQIEMQQKVHYPTVMIIHFKTEGIIHGIICKCKLYKVLNLTYHNRSNGSQYMITKIQISSRTYFARQ